MDWDKIVEEIGPKLFRYFCVRFSPEQSDDLTQETLIRLVRKVEDRTYNSAKGNLRMLAFGIAHFVALEQRRDAIVSSREELLEEDSQVQTLIDEADSVESALITAQNVAILRKKISQLSEKEQQVLSLMVDEEMTLSSISKILQIPEATVKSHVRRAKAKLFSYFQEEGVL